MPTANTLPPAAPRAGAKSAAQSGCAAKAGARRKTAARSATRRQISARHAAARTRTRAPRPERPIRQADTATRETAGVFGDYAERAVLIPVGAALIARDRVVSSVNDTISSYSSTSKAQAQLRRFERRGVTARNRLEREVRKTRVRVERELRQRRREIEKTVSELEERRDAVQERHELANRFPSSPTASRSASSASSESTTSPARTGEAGARESLPASYPAGSSSTLSSLDPRGGPHRPAGLFLSRSASRPACSGQARRGLSQWAT